MSATGRGTTSKLLCPVQNRSKPPALLKDPQSEMSELGSDILGISEASREKAGRTNMGMTWGKYCFGTGDMKSHSAEKAGFHG